MERRRTDRTRERERTKGTAIVSSDEGLMVPGINMELRNRLFASAEQHGYSLERRIESMGRSTSDMCLHLLGGTQRLLVKNRHQHPTIVVLACSTEIQGAYAICAARILASKNIRIYLYLPPSSSPSSSIDKVLIDTEVRLYESTGAKLTQNVNGLFTAMRRQRARETFV